MLQASLGLPRSLVCGYVIWEDGVGGAFRAYDTLGIRTHSSD